MEEAAVTYKPTLSRYNFVYFQVTEAEVMVEVC
jgi:hypothetical protein